jgi:hypothetical protein
VSSNLNTVTVTRGEGVKALLRSLAGKTLHVGILGGDGASTEEPGGLTLAQIGAVLELGTADGHIPARYWLQGTMAERRADIAALSVQLLRRVLAGALTVEMYRQIMGEQLVSWTKERIVAGEGLQPPNAASTIARKGSSRPLVDRGQFINSISYEVR